jgi:hypothetical protein
MYPSIEVLQGQNNFCEQLVTVHMYELMERRAQVPNREGMSTMRQALDCKPHAQSAYVRLQENNPMPGRGINGVKSFVQDTSKTVCVNGIYNTS